jgi:hypothetical protein
MVRTSGYKYLKRLRGLLCHKLTAERVETELSYLINHVNDVYSCGSETEMT